MYFHAHFCIYLSAYNNVSNACLLEDTVRIKSRKSFSRAGGRAKSADHVEPDFSLRTPKSIDKSLQSKTQFWAEIGKPYGN